MAVPSVQSASTIADVAAAYIVTHRLKGRPANHLLTAAESFQSIMGPLPIGQIDDATIDEWAAKLAKVPLCRTGRAPARRTIIDRCNDLKTLVRNAPDMATPAGAIPPGTLSAFACERAPHHLPLAVRFDGWAGSPPLAGLTAERVDDWLRRLEIEGKPGQGTMRAIGRAMQRLLALAAEAGLCAVSDPIGIGHQYELNKVGAALTARIAKAAAMYAIGRTHAEIAKALGVATITVRNWAWRPTTKPLWDAALNRVMRKTAAVVRAQAGTDAILEDVDRYLAMAMPCEKWHNDHGTSIFPDGEKITLPRFYEEYYKPVRLGDASKDTVKWHELLLRRWVLLTGNPPLDEITSIHLARFRDCLLASRGLGGTKPMSPNTVWGYMAFIQGLLDKAGPPRHRNRDAAGIIDRVPWAKPPRKLRRIPRIAEPQELSALYNAAACMEMPNVEGAKPPAWWKALLVTAFNTGFRKGTLFKLRMDWIDWQRRTITIPAEATKTFMAQVIPLNEVCYSHLLRIRGDRELVFQWPYAAKRTFYWNLNKLFELAGIPKEKRFGLHAIRKATATALWEHSPAAAQYTLGHTTPETTRQYYVSGGGIVARALESMPQPEAFTEGMVHGNAGQGKGGAV